MMGNIKNSIEDLVRRTNGVWPGGPYVVISPAGLVNLHTVQEGEYDAVLKRLRNAPSFDDHPDAKCFVQGHNGRWLKNTLTAQVDTDGDGTSWVYPKKGWELTGNVGEVIGNVRDTLIVRPVKPHNVKIEIKGTPYSDFMREAIERACSEVPNDFTIGYCKVLDEPDPNTPPVESMIEVVADFEYITGHELTEAEGRLFLALVERSNGL